MYTNDAFSKTYAEARAKFRAALGEAGGAIVASHRHPLTGPEGEELATDVGWLGPADAGKVLLLVSATHGIEGYAGSGSHTHWLRHGVRDLQGSAVMFIHAINPHGFALGRRVTEDNVDLNRNFLDHAGPHPINQDYEALKAHINPRDWNEDALAKADAAIRAYYGNPNEEFLPKAIHGGQYSNPAGTFFGGTRPTWSNQTFRAIIARWLAPATHVCLIDYHTGSGVYGFAEHYVDDTRAGARARDWFGHCFPLETIERKHGHAQNDVPGLLMNTVAATFPDKRVVSCLVELRTRPARRMLRPIREENWHFQHGDPNTPAAKAARADIRELFYPDDPAWRAMSARQSNELIREALTGMARWD